MATHSSVLAWRIPGTGEPGGHLPSMGSHRVGHDWSDLAAAAVAAAAAAAYFRKKYAFPPPHLISALVFTLLRNNYRCFVTSNNMTTNFPLYPEFTRMGKIQYLYSNIHRKRKCKRTMQRITLERETHFFLTVKFYFSQETLTWLPVHSHSSLIVPSKRIHFILLCNCSVCLGLLSHKIINSLGGGTVNICARLYIHNFMLSKVIFEWMQGHLKE